MFPAFQNIITRAAKRSNLPEKNPNPNFPLFDQGHSERSTNIFKNNMLRNL